MSHITQIIPRLPPAVDGVGDYALNLALRLRGEHGIESRFVVCDLGWRGPGRVEGFRVTRTAARSSGALLGALPTGGGDERVLLHYVGYGYERRGCPRWLVEGVGRWLGAGDGRALLTMFHEVYARGPLWSSSFWLSGVQRRLAARLARLGRANFTSRQAYADILLGMGGGGNDGVAVLPVFSNVGEPSGTPRRLAERSRRLVVFGSRGQRRLVFEKSLGALGRVCRALEISEVFDVGPPVGHGVSGVGGARVTPTGTLPAREVSRILSDAVVGFFNYPTDYLSKSTVFAAYCAHRVAPVAAAYGGRQADGLRMGEHFWDAGRVDVGCTLTEGQRVADSAYDWYRGHDLSTQAGFYASKISSTLCYA